MMRKILKKKVWIRKKIMSNLRLYVYNILMFFLLKYAFYFIDIFIFIII